MSPYSIYQMVQAEQAAQRARYGTAPEQAGAQRQADARLGELAAAVAQCFRGLRRSGLARPFSAVRGTLRRGRRGGAVMDQ